jgi:thioredoxin 1
MNFGSIILATILVVIGGFVYMLNDSSTTRTGSSANTESLALGVEIREVNVDLAYAAEEQAQENSRGRSASANGGSRQAAPKAAVPKKAAPAGDLVLLQFYADWCPPCRAVKPVVNQFASEVSGRVRVTQYNVDYNKTEARKYRVGSIPCFILLRNGKEVARRVGGISKSDMYSMVGL